MVNVLGYRGDDMNTGDLCPEGRELYKNVQDKGVGEYTWDWWMPEEMRSDHIFWMMNWYSSRVGGHFVFPTACGYLRAV